jgi:hypothetical protein
MHKDVIQYCQACDNYQRMKNLVHSNVAKIGNIITNITFHEVKIGFFQPN